MKTVCAWCGVTLGGYSSSLRVSHGICSSCEASVFPEDEEEAPDPEADSESPEGARQLDGSGVLVGVEIDGIPLLVQGLDDPERVDFPVQGVH